jgi:hypothetical protein
MMHHNVTRHQALMLIDACILSKFNNGRGPIKRKSKG